MSSLKEYIQELKQHVAQKGNMSEIEIIRYVYINLGRKMRFDLKYIFGTTKYKKHFDEICIDEEKLEKIFETKNIMCKNLAYLFKRIISEFGIECSVEIEMDHTTGKRLKHAYNIITLKDGKKAIFDLEEDLEYIQTNSKTRFFGLQPDSYDKALTDNQNPYDKAYNQNAYDKVFTDNQIKAIDITTAEYIPWGFYFEDVLAILKLGTKGMQIEERLKNVLDNLNVYVKDWSIGYVERTLYHNRVLGENFSEKERNRIHQIDCYREKDGEKHYVSCIVLDKHPQEGIVFLYSEETGKYEEVGFEGIRNEISNGLVLTQSILGLRKFLKKRTSELDGERMMDALREQMKSFQQLEQITSNILPSGLDENVSEPNDTNTFEKLKKLLNDSKEL